MIKRKVNLKLIIHQASFSEEDKQKSLESSGVDLNEFEDSFFIENEKYAEVSTRRCGRQTMEDRFTAIPKLGEEKGQFFYAVYDGHGGASVARILQKQLHIYLQQHSQFQENIEQAIVDTFLGINKQILTMQQEKDKDGGSTALCALNVKDNLYIINVGDSSCVHVAASHQIEKLNNEHKPDREDEAERIQQHSGYVIEIKNQARINGELAVSRAFGDIKYVDNGVCAIPEITKYKITQSSKWLILATDGFWDIVKIEEIPNILSEWEKNSQDVCLSHYLLEYAINQKTYFKKDNMTLLLVNLKNHYQDLS